MTFFATVDDNDPLLELEDVNASILHLGFKKLMSDIEANGTSLKEGGSQ